MERKRIAFLDEARGIGGAERNLLNIVTSLDHRRFSPLVIVSCKNRLYERLAALNIETLVIKTPRFLSTSFEWRNRRICNPFTASYDIVLVLFKALLLWVRLRKKKIEIIQTNALFEHIYGGIFARLSNITCIWHMQDIPSADFLYGAGRVFINVLAHILPHKIIVISRATRDAFSPKAQKKTVLLYYGIDTDVLTALPDGVDTFKTKLGLNQSSLVVAMTARLVPWKGHQDFLAAAKIVSQKFPEVKFVIAGDTTFGKKHYLKDLQRLAKEFGIADKVIFTGFLEDIRELLSIADIVVHCSVRPEPFGLSLAEAMATGKTVIATDIGGPREIISSGVNGILVPPHNPEALSQAIIELLAAPSKRTELGKAASMYIRQHFSNKKFIETLENIYFSFEKKLNILFVHQSWKGFEKTDYDILRRHFHVSDAFLYKNFFYKTILVLGQLIKSDIVFCWFAYPAAFFPLVLAKLFRKKIIVVVGGWDCANVPEIGYGMLKKGLRFLPGRFFAKCIVHMADKIIAISRYNRKEIICNLRVHSEKIELVYHGIALTCCQQIQENEKKEMVLTVAKVTPETFQRKGLATFIDTARLLPQVLFVLAGEVDRRMQKYLDSRALPGNLQFTGFVDDCRLHQLYREAKVYAQLSYHEQFACSLAEAMAHKCVPVVTSQAALPEVVGEAGFYAPYADAERTAAVIGLALKDIQKGEAARERIRDLFSLEQRETALVALIKKVMG